MDDKADSKSLILYNDEHEVIRYKFHNSDEENMISKHNKNEILISMVKYDDHHILLIFKHYIYMWNIEGNNIVKVYNVNITNDYTLFINHRNSIIIVSDPSNDNLLLNPKPKNFRVLKSEFTIKNKIIYSIDNFTNRIAIYNDEQQNIDIYDLITFNKLKTVKNGYSDVYYLVLKYKYLIIVRKGSIIRYDLTSDEENPIYYQSPLYSLFYFDISKDMLYLYSPLDSEFSSLNKIFKKGRIGIKHYTITKRWSYRTYSMMNIYQLDENSFIIQSNDIPVVYEIGDNNIIETNLSRIIHNIHEVFTMKYMDPKTANSIAVHLTMIPKNIKDTILKFI